MQGYDQYRSKLVQSLADAERRLQTSRGALRIHFQLIVAAYAVIHNRSDALEKIREAMNAVKSRNDREYKEKLYPYHLANAHFTMGLYLRKNGSASKSEAQIQKAKLLLAKLPDIPRVAETYIRFGKWMSYAGERVSNIEYLTHAIIILSAPEASMYKSDLEFPIPKVYLPFPEGFYSLTLGRAHLMLGYVYTYLSEEELALRHAYEAQACFEKIESYVYLCYAQILIADIYLGIDNCKKAYTMFSQAKKTADRSQHIGAIIGVAEEGAQIFLAKKEYEQAEQCCREVIEECSNGSMGKYLGKGYKILGDIFVAKSQYDKACAMYRRSIDEFDAGTFFGPQEGPHIGLSKVCSIKGEHREAIRHAKDALNIAQSFGDTRSEYRCYEVLSQSYKALGDFGKAFECQENYHKIKERALSLAKGERIAALEFNRKLQEVQIEARRHTVLREQTERQLRQREREYSQLTLSLEHKNALLAKRNEAKKTRSVNRADTRAAGDGRQYAKPTAEHNGGHLDNVGYRIERFNPEFLRKLSQAAPELTAAELRVCALTRAQLTVRETADTLCVSESAVLKSRWRIRRKLGLIRGQSLVAALNAL